MEENNQHTFSPPRLAGSVSAPTMKPLVVMCATGQRTAWHEALHLEFSSFLSNMSKPVTNCLHVFVTLADSSQQANLV